MSKIKKSANAIMANADSPEENIDTGKMDPILQQYGKIPGSLITILQEAQKTYGYLPRPILKYIADEVGLAPAKVLGVATFYTQFRLEPVGKYLIMLCQGTACHVNGSTRIEEAITEELGIADGETTDDMLFSLKNVACLGCCSLAPAMMINDEVYGNLTPNSTKKILKELKEEVAVNAN